MPSIGDLRHRISIVRPVSTTRAASGAPVIEYTTISSAVWAAARATASDETYRQDARWSMADVVFTVRYPAASPVLAADVVVYDGARYAVVGTIDADGRRRWLDIIAARTT